VEPIFTDVSTKSSEVDAVMDDGVEVTDAYSMMRSAFISHSQGKVHNIVQTISMIETCAKVADVVKQISAELLDGYAPSDPRWSVSNPTFPPSSVLLLNQLKDKEKIHNEYLNFLSIYDVLEKAGDVVDEVKIYLSERTEMLCCAITLLEMCAAAGGISTIIDDVINAPVLDEHMDGVSGSRREAFFGKVSNIPIFFTELLKSEADKLMATQAIQEQVDLILNVSEIVTQCFQAAWQCRQNCPQKYKVTNHIPWTSSKTGSNNRTLLSHQIDLILNQALGNVDSAKSGTSLTRQVVLLSDLLFDGYLLELASLKEGDERHIEDEFNRERSRVVTALVNAGYFEEATTLAEHYKDFQMLIFLCEKTNDTQKLKYYKVLFKDEGFADVLYKWYVEKGAWSELMTTADNDNDDDTNHFDAMLSSHKQLSWLHFLGANEYTKASDVLTHLASEEKELSDRKKSMLVLANLSILAADEPADVLEQKMSVIDKQIDIVNYQEQVFKSLQKDATDTPPLSPEELIKLCLDASYPVLTDKQYITLVELLKYVSAVNRQTLLLDIWSKCVLQDDWGEDIAMNVDNIAVVTQRVFYKCLKHWRDTLTTAAEEDGGGLVESVPTLNGLTGRFGESVSERTVHQLRVCYEALNMQDLCVGA